MNISKRNNYKTNDQLITSLAKIYDVAEIKLNCIYNKTVGIKRRKKRKLRKLRNRIKRISALLKAYIIYYNAITQAQHLLLIKLDINGRKSTIMFKL